MKPRLSDLLLPAAVLVLLLAGCSMGLGGRGEPTPVSLPPAAAEPVYPIVPGVHRYVDPGGRLVFPSPTPVPTRAPRPTRDFARIFSTPEAPAAATPVPAGVREAPLSCVDQYRRMLLDYDGRLLFGAEVAWSLSEELKGLRPDCVESGWNPVLDTGLACVSGSVAGVDISPGLTRRLHSVALPRALPTGRDDRGNVLVHFERSPLADRPGCWYYNSARRTWAWSVSGVDSGVDRPRFPVCDELLRDLAASAASADGRFGPVDVARALDEARRQLPAECGSLLWNPFPESGSHRDCGVPGVTGRNGDGALVITWHPDYLPADGSVCWALPLDSGSWKFFYPRDDE